MSSGVAYAIASSAGAIGVTAVICGAILASRASAASEQPNRYAKQNHDADEIDFISCRG